MGCIQSVNERPDASKVVPLNTLVTSQPLQTTPLLHENILSAIGNTPIVRLTRLAPPDVKVYVKIESLNPGGSVKDRIVTAMLDDAERRGVLKPGMTVIESTSGNTGVALAMACASKGYPFVAVMSTGNSIERRRIMKFLGARIVLTPKHLGSSGRTRFAEKLAEKHGWWIAGQFENPANPQAHRDTTGPEILRAFERERLDYFVSGFGSGGTLTGVSSVLKKGRPGVHVIAAEPEHCPMLSQGKAGPHDIPGWTPDFIPPILDTTCYEDVIGVSDLAAKETSRALAQKEGILCGPSAGATVWAALEVAKKAEKGSVILAMIPDSCERYLSTGLFADITIDTDIEYTEDL
ncbi:hypothetical protein HDU79_002697 [Rhizoclosmatium sp. JEL0117]|nr:hypothetical protein HDU79_002697 [Rhizoclosmatium sp. JEL0117]